MQQGNVHQETTITKTETFSNYHYSSQICRVTEATKIYIILKQQTTIRKPPIINAAKTEPERKEKHVKNTTRFIHSVKKKNGKNEVQPDVAKANVGLVCLNRIYLVLKIQKMHQSLTAAFS